jgi:hypothetical protein
VSRRAAALGRKEVAGSWVETVEASDSPHDEERCDAVPNLPSKSRVMVTSAGRKPSLNFPFTLSLPIP